MEAFILTQIQRKQIAEEATEHERQQVDADAEQRRIEAEAQRYFDNRKREIDLRAYEEQLRQDTELRRLEAQSKLDLERMKAEAKLRKLVPL